MGAKLGILAGSGVLPHQVAEAARKEGRDVFIVAFEGHADAATIEGFDHAWLRLGAASKIIKTLHRNGCEELVMAGAVRRPSFAELRPDWRGARLFLKAGLAMLGDDGLLRVVRDELQKEGFRLIAPQDVTHQLLMPAGVQTRTPSLPEDVKADIERGVAVLHALAPLDVGQAVVVQQGLVLGIEAIEGTASLIARSKDLHREGRGGVLVKMSKPQQESAFDLPTIGAQTIEQAHAAGLRGIALEAGRSLFLEQEEVLRLCNTYGMFLVGLSLDSRHDAICWPETLA